MRYFVKHSGIVEKITSQSILVRIEPKTSCSVCKIKKSCVAAEMDHKVVELSHVGRCRFAEGENVNVMMRAVLSMKTMFLAYIMPFIVLLVSIVGSVTFLNDEKQAISCAAAIVILYFVFLYYFRTSLRTSSFHIEKKRELYI